MRTEFVPNSTVGGAGDKLHPNRLGYVAMGMAIDLDSLRPAANVGQAGAPVRAARAN